MKKIISLGIFILFVIACQVNGQLNSDDLLTELIESKLNNKSKRIDLSELNSFEWDSLLVLGPYSMVKQIEDTLHLDLKNIHKNSIQYNESNRLLVFLKNGKSIKISAISRKIGELENINLLIGKNDTEFIRTGSGTYNLINERNKNQFRRLIGIPKTAFWKRKNETGNWFNVEQIHNHKNNAIISVYDEEGKLIVKSEFILICAGEGRLIEDLKKEINYFNGEDIQLNIKNCYLMKR